MYRITSVIDLADPGASLGGETVKHIHLVQTVGEPGLFAVVAFANHQAGLVPRGRLSLHDADGARALESFRRWLKQQDVPLAKAKLSFVPRGTYEQIIATSSFDVSLCIAHQDSAIDGRFQEWITSRTVTPVGSRTV